MGGVLLCNPRLHPAEGCARGWIMVVPTPIRNCALCGIELPAADEATLCFPCALRSYVDLQPGAARIFAMDAPSDADWHGVVGFGPSDVMWASSGLAQSPAATRANAKLKRKAKPQVEPEVGYTLELYATGASSVGYQAGQLVHLAPNSLRAQVAVGTVWLARVLCPSGMTYEAAFPAGHLGDPDAERDTPDQRHAPLPERLVRTSGLQEAVVQRELRKARDLVKAVARNRGGRTPDPIDDLIAAIQTLRASGKRPTQELVATACHAHARDPWDLLKHRLKRLRDRDGLTWPDLLKMADDN